MLNSQKGFTLMEALIALFLTSILTTAGFQFYSKMHNQQLAQEEVSDSQQNSRAILQEMAKTIRMAGYKVGAHDAYRISGDSLMVFYSDTQPVDTVLYYLADYNETTDQGAIRTMPEGLQLKRLMKQVNNGAAAIFADQVSTLTITAPTSSTVRLVLMTQATKADEDYNQNYGYRTHVAVEEVNLRNLSL